MLLSDQTVGHFGIQHRRLIFTVPHNTSEWKYIAAIEHALCAECVPQRGGLIDNNICRPVASSQLPSFLRLIISPHLSGVEGPTDAINYGIYLH